MGNRIRSGMLASRARAAAVVIAVTLAVTSCARMSIEEMGRNAIRAHADTALATFTHLTSAMNPADRSELTRQLTEQLPGSYSVTLAEDGVLVDIYLRAHLTTSGGFFGQQRTVSACVRYTSVKGERAMRSVNCPSTGPQSERTDERVTIP
jgi:hypothetical protein